MFLLFHTVCFLSTLTTVIHYVAVYEAGKAVKKGGMPMSQYAPTLYAPSMYAQPAYGGQPGMPLLPLPNGAGPLPPQNGYGRDYDGASSGESCFPVLIKCQLINHFCSSSLVFNLCGQQ